MRRRQLSSRAGKKRQQKLTTVVTLQDEGIKNRKKHYSFTLSFYARVPHCEKGIPALFTDMQFTRQNTTMILYALPSSSHTSRRRRKNSRSSKVVLCRGHDAFFEPSKKQHSFFHAQRVSLEWHSFLRWWLLFSKIHREMTKSRRNTKTEKHTGGYAPGRCAHCVYMDTRNEKLPRLRREI